MISIIIPTLNEEKYLPILLQSIKKQSFSDYELIIADGGSTDKTIEIARQNNCNIIKGGLPAKARNEGAKVAKGEWLLFLDADTILPEDFLKNTLDESQKRSLHFASFYLEYLPGSPFSRFLVDGFYNIPIRLMENILPHAAVGILVKKELFEKLGGFDEQITLAEDHHFARMAKKISEVRLGIIKSTKLMVSDRRFRKDGWFKTGFTYLLCELHMVFIGPVRSDIFNYKFDHYKDNKK